MQHGRCVKTVRANAVFSCVFLIKWMSAILPKVSLLHMACLARHLELLCGDIPLKSGIRNLFRNKFGLHRFFV